MPDLPADLADAVRRTRALLRWYRRPVAAALLVLAALTAAGSAAGGSDGSPVVVAAHDLPAGTPVTAPDLRTVRLPAGSAPTGALTRVDDAVGRTPALPVLAGEPLTPVRFADRSLLDVLAASAGTDLVAVSVPLADGTAGSLVRAGDVVDVLGSGELGGGTVVRGATVLLPPDGGGDTTSGSTSVALAVRGADAAAIARASATSRLSLALRPLTPTTS